MAEWVKSVTVTFQQQQAREKMLRWQAEQDAKRIRHDECPNKCGMCTVCELCGGMVNPDEICGDCGEVND